MGDSIQERKIKLYGSDRTKEIQRVAETLRKSSVLKEGEYNYTTEKLGEDVWQSATSVDFKIGNVEPVRTDSLNGTKQLDTHIQLGQHDPDASTDLRHISTMKKDYDAKNASKPHVHKIDSTVNWPDMAPQYTADQPMGTSEYKNDFMPQIEAARRPMFPKIDTSRMQLPVDPVRFWNQRGTNFTLGSDKPSSQADERSLFSEDNDDWIKRTEDARKLNASLKDRDRRSHVIKDDDYNGTGGNTYNTTHEDYGPRTKPRWCLPKISSAGRKRGKIRLRRKRNSAVKRRSKEASASSGDSGIELSPQSTPDGCTPDDRSPCGQRNELITHAGQHICPDIHKAGKEGRDSQKLAHFQLGTDDNKPTSVYSKDFINGKTKMPKFFRTPSAGKIIQRDPDFCQIGMTSHSVDFSSLPSVARQDHKPTALRSDDDVALSYDISKHAEDRQKSLAHADYVPLGLSLSTNYKKDHAGKLSTILRSEDALPYRNTKAKTAETMDSFTGHFMDADHSRNRLRESITQRRDCARNTKKTHFAFGSTESDFKTVSMGHFQDVIPNDAIVPAAGFKEDIPSFKFNHFGASVNIDATAGKCPPTVMGQDYTPLEDRKITDSQELMNKQFDKLSMQSVAQSHLFHQDNTGRDNFVSTTMEDFHKPEEMTGRKFLAAR